VVRRFRQLSEQEERDRLVARGDLAALTQHPGWERLRQIADFKEQAIRKEIAGKVLRTGELPLSEAQQAYYRGLVEGIHYFVKQPEAAERELEQYLQQTKEVSVGNQ
jgi:hypothetical protein